MGPTPNPWPLRRRPPRRELQRMSPNIRLKTYSTCGVAPEHSSQASVETRNSALHSVAVGAPGIDQGEGENLERLRAAAHFAGKRRRRLAVANHSGRLETTWCGHGVDKCQNAEAPSRDSVRHASHRSSGCRRGPTLVLPAMAARLSEAPTFIRRRLC